MENAKTIKDLLNAAPLSDDDFLAVNQPRVFNPITQKEGDTRKIKIKQLAKHILTELAATANNEGVLGTVTGEEEKQDGSNDGMITILPDGKMKVIGFERLQKQMDIDDISNVLNQPWFNPGTLLGGISWTDPKMEFDYVEILDTLGESVPVARIDPGVQAFLPQEGTHRYHIRVKLLDGSYTIGVRLPVTTYSIIYKVNLLAVTVPLNEANVIVLTFDNYVKITDASGISLTGIDDNLIFLEQPDVKTVRLKLENTYFEQFGTYYLNYDPAIGNILQNNSVPIDAIIEKEIENYADYSPAVFVDAQIPQVSPTTLVLIMSKPIHITDLAKFTLNGTTAKIKKVVSEGATLELQLDEPVDSSEIEPTIKLSYSGDGAEDGAGQTVEAFTNLAVTNNSTNLAITVQAAEVAANNSKLLYVVMQGAITMTNALGFSLLSSDQSELPDLSTSPFIVSDGTIIFNLPINLLNGKSFVVQYNGMGSLRAASNNDTIRGFSQAVSNNSTDTGGIPAGLTARNLSIVVLGREPQTPSEVTQIVTKIHQTIANGQIYNLISGDYFYPAISNQYPFIVNSGYGTGGIYLNANADLGSHGKHIGFRIVSRNGIKGKNGEDCDHVFIQMMNIPGYDVQTNAQGHCMETTNTNANGYSGSQGRLYLVNNFLVGLKAIGIPFDEDWMKAPTRRVAKGNGYDIITDKLFLPTEYEMFGAHTYSDKTQEGASYQGRFEYYDSNDKRIKYDSTNTARVYWLASPYSGSSSYFCTVSAAGAASYNSAGDTYGFAPAFCIG